MIRSLGLIFFITFLCSSCSFFSQKIDDLAQKNQALLAGPQERKINYCEDKTRLQFFAEDESTLKFYRSLDSLFVRKIPFIQKSIMYALLEMNRRPDLISPSSRLQVYLKLDGTNYYFDFYPKNLNSKNSYINGLKVLSEKFNKSSTLANIAGEMDNLIPQQLPVSQELENFLRSFRSELQNNETTTSRFFKGDETITRFETFHRMGFKNIVNNFSVNKFSAIDFDTEKNKLVPYGHPNAKLNVNCNVDLNQLNNQTDEVLSTIKNRVHSMGLIEEDNVFLAVSSSILQQPLVFEKKFIFLQMTPSPFPAPICEFKNRDINISLISSKGRSPVQHLNHLITYNVGQVQNPAELNELLKFSRHLFLNDPDRILYESKRGRKAQLDFFLAMNFPIYHAESLGEVFGSIAYTKDGQKKQSLIIDDRNTSRLSCLK